MNKSKVNNKVNKHYRPHVRKTDDYWRPKRTTDNHEAIHREDARMQS